MRCNFTKKLTDKKFSILVLITRIGRMEFRPPRHDGGQISKILRGLNISNFIPLLSSNQLF